MKNSTLNCRDETDYKLEKDWIIIKDDKVKIYTKGFQEYLNDENQRVLFDWIE